MKKHHVAASSVLLTLAVSQARADDDVDVAAFEYVDVVETAEGSIWKGVVTEQSPNIHYKIATADGSIHVIQASTIIKVTKQRNPNYRKSVAAATPAAPAHELSLSDDTSSAPEPLAKAGVRIEPELAVAIPRGDLVDIGMVLDYRASFAPGFRVGYETFHNNVGLTAGVMGRYTSWRLPIEIEQLGSHWTLETQAFGRAAMQLGRVAPYAALALGVDTNHTVNNVNGISVTAMGFGMNLQGGLAIAASPSAAFDLGVDFHPGTDTIEEGVDASVSYFAFRLGASFRL